MGDYDDALQLLKRALQIDEKERRRRFLTTSLFWATSFRRGYEMDRPGTLARIRRRRNLILGNYGLNWGWKSGLEVSIEL